MPDADPQPGAEDLAGFAQELERMAAGGGLDPLALLTGAQRVHSLFLAPLSPALVQGIERFLADGSGPLAQTPAMLVQQGVAAGEAPERARQLFRAAQGVVVVVLAAEGTIGTIPQLFFGDLTAAGRGQLLAALPAQLPGRERVGDLLAAIAVRAQAGTRWPLLYASLDATAEPTTYWLELAHALAEAQEAGMSAQPERLADLGHWIGAALAALGQGTLDADDAAALARCHLAGGEWQAAGSLLARAAGELDEEDWLTLLGAWAEVAAARGDGLPAAHWLAERRGALAAVSGAAYDLARAQFRLLASAQAGAAELIPVARDMLARDKKACRHDLTREPLWAVLVREPGELLETAAAATAISRSPAFVARRLEQGTIPSVRAQGQVRIPAQGLAAWHAVMTEFRLLEG